ncbi:hypothetical protein [Paenibacillus hamazuiensis]|uniref:hypothetical protein n=1 Tax=Paenibacillus hamazuiensis TaxID=2936508 RepID=UPI00200D1B02|nr:hypothetical protein [Paenibacillus hamazuiensis]
MKPRHMFTASVVASMLATAVPAAALAAPIEIAASTKSALDKTVAQANQSQADRISSLYEELLALQKEQKDWDEKIKSLHAANQDNLSALGKQIKQIDAGELDRLESVVANTRKQYEPLLSRYTTLNKQLEAARNLKSKDLSGLLRIQISLLKVPVQLARADIKAKETSLRTAKAGASQKMKDIRGLLEDRDPLNEQIKTVKSAIKSTESEVSPVLSAFKQAVKKGDVSAISDSLTTLVSLSRQINEKKQAIYNLESRISAVLADAEAKLP